MPDLFSFGSSVLGSFEKHYPKTIDLNQEPYLTRWRYYRWTVGMADFESTLLVWAENNQPLSPDDQKALQVALKNLSAKGALPPFDSGQVTGVSNGPPDQRKLGDFVNKLDNPVASASVGGFPMTYILLAGVGTAIFLAARR